MHLAHAATKPRPGAVLTVADLHRRCASLASQVLPEAEMTERQTKPGKRWIAKVKTDSTHPPPGFLPERGLQSRGLWHQRGFRPKDLDQACECLHISLTAQVEDSAQSDAPSWKRQNLCCRNECAGRKRNGIEDDLPDHLLKTDDLGGKHNE